MLPRYSLRDMNGELVTGQEELETMASTFYEELFTAQAVLEPDDVLEHVLVRATSAMNEVLESPYTAQEVERALAMMGASKALGQTVSRQGSTKRTGRRLARVLPMLFCTFSMAVQCLTRLTRQQSS